MIIAGLDITDGTIFELLGLAALGGSLMQRLAHIEKKVDQLTDIPEKIARLDAEVEAIKDKKE